MADEAKFTEGWIKALKAPDSGRAEYRDATTAGLYLRVSPNGVKTFSFLGRTKGSGRLERVSIGRWDAVKVKQAQAKAKALGGDMAEGTSVTEAGRARRAEMTVSKLLEEYINAKPMKHPDKLRDLFRLYVAPTFGNRKLSEMDHIKVAAWHRSLPTKINARRSAAAKARANSIERGEVPVKSSALRMAPTAGTRSANQALSLLHAIYRWAIESARLYAGNNPAHGIPKFKEQSRERFLGRAELKPFFDALLAYPETTMRCFFFAALMTGARRANVLAMRWADLDLTEANWRIPETKNGTPQTVTLAPELVEMLHELRGAPTAAENDRLVVGLSPWVFASSASKTGHLVEPKGAWKTILKQAGLADLRIHDLRRTLGSWQAGAGASLVLIGKSLNHRSPMSTNVYARLELDPVRQSVERATSAMLEAAGVKPSAQVIALKTA